MLVIIKSRLNVVSSAVVEISPRGAFLDPSPALVFQTYYFSAETMNLKTPGPGLTESQRLTEERG